MKETIRIAGLFSDLYNGEPWLDVTINATLKDLSVAQATFRISENRNSIWEIVNHMISWRENVLQRVQGVVIVTSQHNYFERVEDQSLPAWEETLKKLKDTQKRWLDFLDKFNEDDFDKVSLVNNVSHYKHIHGILQHDAYHLGQIVLMVKLIE